ncbi:hypothetical protein KAR91_10595 [Candidatus Pacearchaeota archaeon]|nr:hypothetical protein [Candidatus Pacearchaeota archaeon]
MENIATKVNGETVSASEYNQPNDELENAITASGITLSGADLSQLAKTMTNHVGSANFYSDTGAANAYVINIIGSFQAPTVYQTGMMVRFTVANPNTGASTINVSSLGVQNIKRGDGTDVEADDLTGQCILVYDGTNFVLLSFGLLEVLKLIAPTVVSDAIEAGTIATDIIQPKTASGPIALQNSNGDEIGSFEDDGVFNPGRVYSEALTAAETRDFVFSNGSSGKLTLRGQTSGNTQHDVEAYELASSAFTASIDLIANPTSVNLFSFAFLSNSGSPDFQNTFRLTCTADATIALYAILNTGSIVSIS